MVKGKHKRTIFFIIVLLLTACAPGASTGRPSSSSVSAPETASITRAEVSTKPDWEQKWEGWLNEAKKEGKLMLYTSSGPQVRKAINEGFQRRYGLNVEAVGGTGGEISERFLAQRRAGLYLVDAFMSGAATTVTLLKPAGAVDPLEPVLILPEVIDPKVWWGGELRWLDKSRTLIAFQAAAQSPLIVNSEMVKSDEIKSYQDLLHPKWKGKIAMFDPTVVGFGSKWTMVMGLQIMNLDYLRKFATQEPYFSRDHRLLAEWVARGKYPVGIAIKPEIIKELRDAGAPLRYVDPEEGTWLSSGTGTIALVNRAPHPNAVRVFINWLLTKEGASFFASAYGTPSARLDVSTEGIEPTWLPKPGVKYFIGDLEEFTIKEPEFYQIARDIFGPLLKR